MRNRPQNTDIAFDPRLQDERIRAILRITQTPLYFLAPFLAFAVSAARAQTDSDSLDQRLRLIERKLEIQNEEAAAMAQSAVKSSVGEKGLAQSSADGAFEFKLRGLFHTDARLFVGSTGANDTFLLRRVEPAFELTLGRLAYFRLQPHFASDNVGTSDVYGELRFAPWANLRVVKFKPPVVLENLQSSSAISFERAVFTRLQLAF